MIKFKKKNKILILVAILLILNGCSQMKMNNNITITDMANDVVEIKKNPKKVACISRTTYDLLIAYGLGDKIDGVYDKVLDNEWVQVLYPNSINHYHYKYENSHELYIKRGVDLVFAPEKYIADELRNHGICAVTISLYGNPTYDNYVTYLADFCEKVWDDENVKNKSEKWKNKVKNAILDIEQGLSKYNTKKESIFYVRGDKDYGINYTDTKGSFVEYAYRKLGFDCISNSLNNTKPSIESIIELNPDIFVMGGIYQHKHIEDIKTLEPYKKLEAVKQNKLYTIPIGFTQMEQLNALTPEFFYDQANKLYPEIFHFDVPSMIKTSVKEYFGINLSDKQVAYMLNGLNPEGDRVK